MSPEANDLLKRALALPEDQRAALANTLLDSLEASDPDAEKAWEHEIQQRMRDLEAGKAVTVPWEDVKRRLGAIVNGR